MIKVDTLRNDCFYCVFTTQSKTGRQLVLCPNMCAGVNMFAVTVVAC